MKDYVKISWLNDWFKSFRWKYHIESICHKISQKELQKAATLGTLKSGRLIEVDRLTEVQYKSDGKGSKRDFIASI